ncbi:MAG TPA: hypothetical protein VD997_05555 [Phycisphaerales bacterium]|nr:hypothetical protein [Phycisphaerales bacterium]
MFGRDQILIGLSPTCLRVATLKGGRLQKVVALPLDATAWEQTWENGLSGLDDKLATAIKELGVARRSAARVVYYSRKATAEVYSPPVRGAAAFSAAQFSLNESLPSHGEPWPTSLHPLESDPASAANPKVHILGMADAPADTEAIANWVRRAGLTIRDFIPAKAAALKHAVRVASSLPPSGTHAVLWVADHATVLAGWSEGRLIFARSLDFGFHMLADAVMRGSRIADRRGISQPMAYATLFQAGVPQRGVPVTPTEAGVVMDGVIPLMQPVFQRYAIETRQTLRFSVPESEQARLKITLAGPGASVPGFAQALEAQFDTGIEVHLEDHGDQVPAQDAGELGGFGHYAAVTGVVSPTEFVNRMNGRLYAGVRLGGVIAAMALLAHAGWTYAQTSRTRRQIDSLQERVEAMSAHELQVARAQQLSTDLAAATQSIKDTIGDRPRWIAGLALVSRDCGDVIELNHIAGTYGTDKERSPILTLSGTAYPGNGKDSLTEFVTRLSKSPVVAGVKIVSTHASEISGVEAKTFIVSVQLRGITADVGLAGVLDAKPAGLASVEEQP